MNEHVVDYTILIDKEQRTGTDELCYVAQVPVLGIATEADTLDEVQTAIHSLIQFHLESLAEEGEEIPVEHKNSLITKFEITLPEKSVVA